LIINSGSQLEQIYNVRLGRERSISKSEKRARTPKVAKKAAPVEPIDEKTEEELEKE
jgi:hypothetical protein